MLQQPLSPAQWQTASETVKPATSLDDILSSSPNASFSGGVVKADVLEPRRITREDIEMKKEEERKTSLTLDESDPYVSTFRLPIVHYIHVLVHVHTRRI